MRRTLPQHFKLDGSPKRSYASRAEAEAAATAQNTRDSVYRCDFCGAYHRATPKSPTQGVKNR